MDGEAKITKCLYDETYESSLPDILRNNEEKFRLVHYRFHLFNNEGFKKNRQSNGYSTGRR